jgi:hypothetical protein
MKLHAPTIALTVSLALGRPRARNAAMPRLVSETCRSPPSLASSEHDGVRNNAKTIDRLPMEIAGFAGRPK